MPDFSVVFREEGPVCETAWLMLGTFVPACFPKEKTAQGMVGVIFHRGVFVCHGDGIPGED